MRIEKINDNQIRCILSHEELASRHIRMSELAGGSIKAHELFQDLMKQAHFEFGFEADNIPLSIEAMPAAGEALVLLVTKINDPEELDRRFAALHEAAQTNAENNLSSQGGRPTEKQNPTGASDDISASSTDASSTNTSDDAKDNKEQAKFSPEDTLLNCLERLGGAIKDRLVSLGLGGVNSSSPEEEKDLINESTLICAIKTFQDLQHLAKLVGPQVIQHENFESHIYYHPKKKLYYLVVVLRDHKEELSRLVEDFFSEYGIAFYASPIMLQYIKEHMDLLLPYTALDELQKMK